MSCIFCNIIANEIPSERVYEDDKVIAFKDINPATPVHILVIPKVHIEGVHEIDSENSHYVARAFEVIRTLAEEFHLEKGYRVITNVKEYGGQSVPHLHFHLLGGKNLGEKII